MRPDRTVLSGMPVAAVILAAGRGMRMGRPKPLLEFGGEPLVRRAAAAALAAGFQDVVVVTRPELSLARAVSGLPVRLVVNPQADEGVGTSIATGVSAIDPAAAWMGLLLCDQPLVTAAHLERLRGEAQAGASIVASRYAGTFGVPAVFARAFFADLSALRGDSGCKGLIRARLDVTTLVDCPEAAADVDTPADLAAIIAGATVA